MLGMCLYGSFDRGGVDGSFGVGKNVRHHNLHVDGSALHTRRPNIAHR